MRGNPNVNVRELTRDQLIELKTNMIYERGGSMSWNELVGADNLISDAEVFERYAGVYFFDDDFYCSVGTTHAEPVQVALF